MVRATAAFFMAVDVRGRTVDASKRDDRRHDDEEERPHRSLPNQRSYADIAGEWNANGWSVSADCRRSLPSRRSALRQPKHAALLRREIVARLPCSLVVEREHCAVERVAQL